MRFCELVHMMACISIKVSLKCSHKSALTIEGAAMSMTMNCMSLTAGGTEKHFLI